MGRILRDKLVCSSQGTVTELSVLGGTTLPLPAPPRHRRPHGALAKWRNENASSKLIGGQRDAPPHPPRPRARGRAVSFGRLPQRFVAVLERISTFASALAEGGDDVTPTPSTPAAPAPPAASPPRSGRTSPPPCRAPSRRAASRRTAPCSSGACSGGSPAPRHRDTSRAAAPPAPARISARRVKGDEAKALIANSFFSTLNTECSGPNGKSSYAPGNPRHSF